MLLQYVLCLLLALGLLTACAGMSASPNLTSSQLNLYGFSEYVPADLINQDALRPLDLALIPNYNNIDPSFLSPYFDPGGDTQGRRPALRNEKL